MKWWVHWHLSAWWWLSSISSWIPQFQFLVFTEGCTYSSFKLHEFQFLPLICFYWRLYSDSFCILLFQNYEYDWTENCWVNGCVSAKCLEIEGIDFHYQECWSNSLLPKQQQQTTTKIVEALFSWLDILFCVWSRFFLSFIFLQHSSGESEGEYQPHPKPVKRKHEDNIPAASATKKQKVRE